MLERALALSDSIGSRERRRELKLRAIMLLGPLVTHLDGPRAAEAVYARGQDLCFELPEGQRGDWFPILWGWWFTASDLTEQARRSEVLISDVSTAEAPEARLQALHCGWATLFDLGDHDRSLAAVNEGLALYDPAEAERSRHRYGHDARVCGLGERAQSLWMLGDVAGSRAAISEAEEWGNATGHAPSILHALDMATLAAFYRRDQRDLSRILARVAGMAEAGDMPVVAAKRQIFEGWIAARSGDRGAGAQVRQGLETLRDLGALEDTPVYADIAADTAAHCGDPAGALPALEAEIVRAREARLLFWLPELLLRRAILGRAVGQDVAAWLDEGLEVALAQNAHMLVLRNVAARVDLGLPVDARLRDLTGERIGLVDASPLRRQVLNALGL